MRQNTANTRSVARRRSIKVDQPKKDPRDWISLFACGNPSVRYKRVHQVGDWSAVVEKRFVGHVPSRGKWGIGRRQNIMGEIVERQVLIPNTSTAPLKARFARFFGRLDLFWTHQTPGFRLSEGVEYFIFRNDGKGVPTSGRSVAQSKLSKG